MLTHSDTILAKSSGSGKAAITLLRMSGPLALGIMDSICDRPVSGKDSHTISLRRLQDGDRLIDEGLISVFKAPNTYTGEDLVEISIHGSDYIEQQVSALLLAKGARMAAPGEFTSRAFLNGKLDLAQAEAVADLIASSTEAEHRIAMNQLRGGFSDRLKAMRGELMDFAALIELELDFGEEDVEFAGRERLLDLVQHISAELDRLRSSFSLGNAIRTGIPVAIIGRPNAGKSTLLNCLLGEERAIVTELEGTTRDTIEEDLVISGIRFKIIDTAGLRETENVVEKIGIERSYASALRASIVLYIYDAGSLPAIELQQDLEALKTKTPALIWPVANKTDKINNSTQESIILAPGSLGISAKAGDVGSLMRALEQHAVSMKSEISDSTVSNLRHLEALNDSFSAMGRVRDALDNRLSGDMLSAHLREAMQAIGRITGEIDSDEVLGAIFSKFCIGK